VRVFFDTSAWVPLLLREAATENMRTAKKQVSEIWAWEWMRVETEAALTRRKATPQSWIVWKELQTEVSWVDLDSDQTDSLCSFNRALGLRAADVGHLFVFDRLFAELPDLVLLTLDGEMAAAARRIGLPLHPACA